MYLPIDEALRIECYSNLHFVAIFAPKKTPPNDLGYIKSRDIKNCQTITIRFKKLLMLLSGQVQILKYRQEIS